MPYVGHFLIMYYQKLKIKLLHLNNGKTMALSQNFIALKMNMFSSVRQV